MRNARIRFPAKEAEALIRFYKLVGEPRMAELLKRDFDRLREKAWSRDTNNFGKRQYVTRKDAAERILSHSAKGNGGGPDFVQWRASNGDDYTRAHIVREKNEDGTAKLYCGRTSPEGTRKVKNPNAQPMCRRCTIRYAKEDVTESKREEVAASA